MDSGKLARELGLRQFIPCGYEPRGKVVKDFVEAGFEAYIVVVNQAMMPSEFVGRKFTTELIDELEALGIDSCGSRRISYRRRRRTDIQ